MRLVLHVCCAPCAVYPIDFLKQNHHDVHLFFYNPNIHPYQEYRKRLENFQCLAEELNLPFDIGNYRPRVYFESIGKEFDKPERCRYCYRLRLKETMDFAQNLGFSSVTTTMLVSPYQNQSLIVEEGNRLAAETRVEFVNFDFLKGYYQGVKESRRRNLYHQWYCGCLFSEIERTKEKEAGKNARV